MLDIDPRNGGTETFQRLEKELGSASCDGEVQHGRRRRASDF